jgi:hypothetical protein
MKSWEAGSTKEKKEKTKWYLFELISVALPRARTTDFHILIYLKLLESNSTTRLTMRIMVVKMCMGWICLFFEPVQGSLAKFIVHHLKSPSINITRIDRIINQEQNWVLSGLIGFAASSRFTLSIRTTQLRYRNTISSAVTFLPRGRRCKRAMTGSKNFWMARSGSSDPYALLARPDAGGLAGTT